MGKPFIGDSVDPLFFGVAGSLAVLWLGSHAARRTR